MRIFALILFCWVPAMAQGNRSADRTPMIGIAPHTANAPALNASIDESLGLTIKIKHTTEGIPVFEGPTVTNVGIVSGFTDWVTNLNGPVIVNYLYGDVVELSFQPKGNLRYWVQRSADQIQWETVRCSIYGNGPRLTTHWPGGSNDTAYFYRLATK